MILKYLIIIIYILVFGARIIKIIGTFKAKIVEKSTIPMLSIMFLNNFLLITYCYLRKEFALLFLYCVLAILELTILLMVIYYSFFYKARIAQTTQL